MEKRLLTIFFILILVMTHLVVVMAFDFDNVPVYKNADRTVEIKNAFGLGSKIGEVTILSHKDVNEVLQVPIGNNIPVLSYNVSGGLSIDDVDFINNKNAKEIIRSVHFNSIRYETVTYPVVVTHCKNPKDPEDCTQETIRYETEQEVRRVPFTKSVTDNGMILELVTDVHPGDYVDGIFTFDGVKIDKHASWNASYQEGIKGVYDFNQPNSNLTERVYGVFNLTNRSDGANEKYSIVTSILPNGIGIVGNDGFFNPASNDVLNNPNGSVIMWIQPSELQSTADMTFWSTDTGNNRLGTISGKMQLTIGGTNVIFDANKTYFQKGQMLMITATWDTTADIYKIYINDTLEISSTTPAVYSSENKICIGNICTGSRAFQGNITDFKSYNYSLNQNQISQQFNNFTGLAYIPLGGEISLTSTLVYPTNGQVLPNNNPEFFAGSFTSSQQNNLTNATLTVYNITGGVYKTNFTTLSGISNTTNLTLSNFVDGNYSYNFLVCGVNTTSTRCTYASSNFSFSLQSVSFNNFTFNTVVLEGSSQDFRTNLTLASGQTITNATLFYNRTYYDATINNFDLPRIILSRTLDAPLVSASTNISFLWQVTVSGSLYNSSSNNQTVENFNVDNCTTNTRKIFTLTDVDEETQIAINNSVIETALNIYNINRNILISSFFGNFSSPVSICINSAINNSNYSLDLIAKYSSPVHAIEYYNILNATLSNSTSAQNITLYDLNSSISTPFKITFTDQFLSPIANVLVYVERQYISENVFKVVELPVTDSNGQTIVHLVNNDVIYNLVFVKNGVILARFNKITAFCQDISTGNCQFPLSSTSITTGIPTASSLFGIILTAPTYNSTTKDISVDFSSTDGTSKTVFMNVSRNDLFGNTTLCGYTLTSSSGSLTCNIGNITDTIINVQIYADGELVSSSSVSLDAGNLGGVGFGIWFILTLVCIFMFSESKMGILVSLLLSFVGAIALGLSKGNLLGGSGKVGAGIWVIILIVVSIYLVNREGKG